MICEHCKGEIADDATICMHCRKPTSAGKANNLAVVLAWIAGSVIAFILGIQLLLATFGDKDEPVSARIERSCKAEYATEDEQNRCRIALMLKAADTEEEQRVRNAAQNAGVH